MVNEQIKVIKKDSTTELFNGNKIIKAIEKTALRCNVELDDIQKNKIVKFVMKRILKNVPAGGITHIYVSELHEEVELALHEFNPALAKEYNSFRGYKKKMKEHFEEMLRDTEQLLHAGDTENANRDSYLIDAQKVMSGEIFSVRNMLDYELPKDASQAHKDGDIYIHDLRDRLYNSINCCLFDMGKVLKGGFTYKGVSYKEPNSIRTACSMLEDVMNSARLQQYGRR